MDLNPPPNGGEASVARRFDLRASTTTLFAATAITLATWPIVRLAPERRIDGSWWAGLHMAAHRGMDFGTDVGFTYGPLGFLDVTRLFYPWTTALAVFYAVVVYATFIALVFHPTSRRVGPLWAAVVAIAVGTVALVEPAELVPLAYLLACAACVSFEVPEARTRAVVFAGTALGVFQLLVKFNTGVVVLLLAAALACSLQRRRARTMAIHVAGSAVLLPILWVLAGQPVGALTRWLRMSLELTAGYSSAMALEQRSRWWEYPLALIALAAVAVLAARRAGGGARRLGVSLLMSVVVFAQWKHGFVRHDLHSAGFFLTLALIALSLLWLGGRPRNALSIAFVLLGITALVLPHQTKSFLFRPTKSFSQISVLANGPRRDAFIAASRERLKKHYRVDTGTLRFLAGRGVHADPDLAALAWIYELDWNPAPIFQAYTVYTPWLDATNAAALTSRSGPERILRNRPSAIDDRNPMFESPAYVLAMLCNYREVSRTRGYEVLARSAGRCGTPRRLSTFRNPSGFVPVPAAPEGSALFMRVTTTTSLFDRLRALVHKPGTNALVAIRTDGSTKRYRLIEATAGGSLVLCVPGSAGFNAHFVQTTCPDAVEVTNRRVEAISFFAVAMERPAP